MCKSVVHYVEQEGEEEQFVGEEELFIGCVTQINEVKLSEHCKWIYPLVVGTETVHVKLDTGAGANLINQNDFAQLSKKPVLKQTTVRLTDYNGAAIEVKGVCILPVTVRGRRQNVQFIVVNDGPSLLGSRTCERLNLVKRVMTVHDGEEAGKECLVPEVREKLSSLPFEYHIRVSEKAIPVIKPARRVPIALRQP